MAMLNSDGSVDRPSRAGDDQFCCHDNKGVTPIPNFLYTVYDDAGELLAGFNYRGEVETYLSRKAELGYPNLIVKRDTGVRVFYTTTAFSRLHD